MDTNNQYYDREERLVILFLGFLMIIAVGVIFLVFTHEKEIQSDVANSYEQSAVYSGTVVKLDTVGNNRNRVKSMIKIYLDSGKVYYYSSDNYVDRPILVGDMIKFQLYDGESNILNPQYLEIISKDKNEVEAANLK